jgi:hypothetical protein
MDKEQARFILQSFRPDGADVDNRDFAEALAMATRDRELGEWLAVERAFDGSFAAALTSIELPQCLRDDILGCLAARRGDYPQASDATDRAMIGAFASIQAPPALRGQILMAMERSRAPDVVVPPSLWRRLAIPMAAAAGIALALVLTRETSLKTATAGHAAPVSVDVVQAGFISTYESPIFSLDMKREDHRELVNHLKSRKLPCPGCLPKGLEKVKGIGCRELVINGKRGSLVCYDERENGVVHLVIFRREDVTGEVPARERANFSQHGNWAAARWGDDKNVFILIGATDVGKLSRLF